MICFSNASEIDIRAVTTLGVNAKGDASAIGYFGTGLKYALAVLLRHQQKISIWSGTTKYEFTVEPFQYRGKLFDRIMTTAVCDGKIMHFEALGFTTDLGKNWTLANAYRELWSNCQDEKGEISQLADSHMQQGFVGKTLIFVEGEDFELIHLTRFGSVLLPPSLPEIGQLPAQLEVYAGQSQYVYYRGIQAGRLSKPALFTYNIIENASLTEDRTLAGGDYTLMRLVKQWTTQAAPQALAEQVVSASEGQYESELCFSYESNATPRFLDAVRTMDRLRPLALNSSVRDLLARMDKAAKPEVDIFPPRELDSIEQGELESAKQDLEDWGYPLDGYEIIVTEHCGERILGRALQPNVIVIAYSIIRDCDMLRQTLLEELIHLRFDVRDETRAFQEVVLMEIIRHGYKINELRAELQASRADMEGAA